MLIFRALENLAKHFYEPLSIGDSFIIKLFKNQIFLPVLKFNLSPYS